MFSLLTLSGLAEENILFQNKHYKGIFSVFSCSSPFPAVSRSTATKVSYGMVGKVPPFDKFALNSLKNFLS